MNQILDSVLLQGKALLDDAGLPFFLVAGTLLGIKRESELLAHDGDVDVGFLPGDLTPKIKRKIKGYRLFIAESECVSSCGQLSFNFGKHFDMFPLHLNKDRTKRFHNHKKKIGVWWPALHFKKPWPKIRYLGLEWNIPVNADDYLKHKFGDWHQVNKTFDWKRDSLNFTEDVTKL